MSHVTHMNESHIGLSHTCELIMPHAHTHTHAHAHTHTHTLTHTHTHIHTLSNTYAGHDS